MFERSRTFSRFQTGGNRVLSIHLGYVPYLEPEGKETRRGWAVAVAAAVLLHIGFFVVVLPEARTEPRSLGPPRPVYVVRQVRFKPPPPVQQQVPQRKEKRRIVPIPDPTPDEPEPIRVAEVEIPEVDYFSDDDALFGIPEGPPGPGMGGPGPLRLTGDIVPPVKIHYPVPRYTEEGRQARIQGVVILEAVVDAAGDVRNVKVLKGLEMGLTESAVETAREWKFKPATLNGEPVAVYFNLTIRFSLQ